MPKKISKTKQKNLKNKVDELTKELAEYKTTNGKLSLIESPINQKQLLKILQRTPQEHIYTRPGKGGGQWEFVTGTYVKKVLNYAFGWLWDFQIVDKGREGNQIWVQGRLTIKSAEGNPIVIKEQFGRADVKVKRGTSDALDYGNDLKAASTDALKKCASELGIASDIYGKNEFKDVKPLKPTTTIKKPVKTENSTKSDEKKPIEGEVVVEKHVCMGCDAVISSSDAEISIGLSVDGKEYCSGCLNQYRK